MGDAPIVPPLRAGPLIPVNPRHRHLRTIDGKGGTPWVLVTSEAGAPAGIVSLDDIVDGLAVELASAAALMKGAVRAEFALPGA